MGFVRQIINYEDLWQSACCGGGDTFHDTTNLIPAFLHWVLLCWYLHKPWFICMFFTLSSNGKKLQERWGRRKHLAYHWNCFLRSSKLGGGRCIQASFQGLRTFWCKTELKDIVYFDHTLCWVQPKRSLASQVVNQILAHCGWLICMIQQSNI